MTESKREYLHVAYVPDSAGWGLGVVQALQRAESAELRALGETWADSYEVELALAVTTKLAVLGEVVRMVDREIANLSREISNLGDLSRFTVSGAGFVPEDRALPYRLVMSVDAFIYESRSAYEILGKFLGAFAKKFLNRALTQSQLVQIIGRAGIDDEWIRDLQDQRIDFFHNTAPWVAIEVRNHHPLDAELLVFKKTVHHLPDDASAIPFARLRAIHAGLARSFGHLQGWLITEVRARDQHLTGNN